METLLNAATELKNITNIKFILAGGGTELNKILQHIPTVTDTKQPDPRRQIEKRLRREWDEPKAKQLEFCLQKRPRRRLLAAGVLGCPKKEMKSIKSIQK